MPTIEDFSLIAGFL